MKLTAKILKEIGFKPDEKSPWIYRLEDWKYSNIGGVMVVHDQKDDRFVCRGMYVDTVLELMNEIGREGWDTGVEYVKNQVKNIAY